MADEKTALEAHDEKHLKEAGKRRAAIDKAMEETRAAQRLLEEARAKAARLQREHVDASFAYDAERAEFVAAAAGKTKAA